SALVGLGFIYQIMGQLSDAIESYHKVLAIRPSDQIASEMLQAVMEDKVRISEMEWMHEYLPEELRDDQEVERKIKALTERRAKTASHLRQPASTAMTAKRKASVGSGRQSGDIKGKMRKEEVEEQDITRLPS
ncbi:hypothetical protein BGZ72_010887, partial [Mortierella alpina]